MYLRRVATYSLILALALGVGLYGAVCRAPVVDRSQTTPTPTIVVIVAGASGSPTADPTLVSLLAVNPTILAPEIVSTPRPTATPTPEPSATATATTPPPTPTVAVQRG